jgi:peptidoglycan hydrolase CwlO-like protein
MTEFDQSDYSIITINDKLEIIINKSTKYVNYTKLCIKISDILKTNVIFDKINNETLCQELIKSHERKKIESDLRFDHKNKLNIEKLLALDIYYQIPKKTTSIYNGTYGPLYILDYIILTSIPEFHSEIIDALEHYKSNDYQLTISKRVAEIHSLKSQVMKSETEIKSLKSKINDLEDELEETKQEIKYKKNDLKHVNEYNNTLNDIINTLQLNIINMENKHYNNTVSCIIRLIIVFTACLIVLCFV